MVIRGSTRGNGKQLAYYLLAKQENEHIRVLEVNGLLNADAKDLHLALHSMQLTSELTKSDKGLYHAQINPAIDESKLMDDASWMQATDILAKQLGMENQRRAIVLHTKKGRTHAHVVFERYDLTTGKMVNDSFSRLAQDRARKEMELVFKHKPTPHRNKHRPELKASLSALWHSTGTGAQFLTAARKNGYIIAEGSGRSPYIVVDEFARSYDLTRQLQGVRLKDVRQRLRSLDMPGEKDAIALARKNLNEQSGKGGEKDAQGSKGSLRYNFATNKQDATIHYNIPKDGFKQNAQTMTEKGMSESNSFQENKEDIRSTPDKQDKTNPVKENKEDITGKGGEPIDPRRLAFRDEMKRLTAKNKGKGRDKGKDLDL